jgi:uncharacterized protein YjdB
VKGIGVGKAIITATVDGMKYKCKVTIKEVYVSSITFDETDVELEIGEQDTLFVVCNPSGRFASGNVKWSSSNKKVVDVDKGGTLYAKKEGTAVITAIYKGRWATCIVTVGNDEDSISTPVSSITLSDTSLSIPIGDTYKLNATISPTNADNQSIIWSSGNERVATVKNGVVTAVSTGTTTIIATVGGKSATCIVNVSVDENIKKLKQYISKNGATNVNGNKFIKYTTGTDREYTMAIVYLEQTDELEFISVASDAALTIVMTSADNTATLQADYTYSAGNVASFAAIGYLEPATYYSDKTIAFKITKGSFLTNEKMNKSREKLCNSELKIGFSGWNVILLSNLYMNLNDIGFISY